MSSSDLDLRNIQFQSQLRSKPVRLNFANIQSEFNSLRAEVSASLSSTASEVTSARDNQSSLSNNIHLRKGWQNVVSGTADYKPSASNLVITIDPGNGIVNGIGVGSQTAATASVNVPASGKKRLDLVVIDTANSIGVLSGTAVSTASATVFPAIAITEQVLAHWTIFNTTATLSVIDDRQKIIDPWQAEKYMEAGFAYNGDTMSTLTLINENGLQRFYQFNYVGDTLSTIGTDIEGMHYRTTYIYNGDTLSTITQAIG